MGVWEGMMLIAGVSGKAIRTFETHNLISFGTERNRRRHRKDNCINTLTTYAKFAVSAILFSVDGMTKYMA